MDNKIKEPAQSANCTSSTKENNLPKYDDTSCCRICQEKLLEDLKRLQDMLCFNEHNLFSVKPEACTNKMGKASGYIDKMIKDMERAGDSE